MKLVLGSRNSHKLQELSSLLAPHQLLPLPDGIALPDERGQSFSDNALEKARATAGATAIPALGEDSGIAVRALGGAPGVRSARYAGENASDADNLVKLLFEMERYEDRAAAYVCALALAMPGGDGKVFEASCAGELARAPRGTGGFGYDPIFMPSEGASRGLTMAELAPDQKNAMSHRGKAARLLLEWLS